MKTVTQAFLKIVLRLSGAFFLFVAGTYALKIGESDGWWAVFGALAALIYLGLALAALLVEVD